MLLDPKKKFNKLGDPMATNGDGWKKPPTVGIENWTGKNWGSRDEEWGGTPYLRLAQVPTSRFLKPWMQGSQEQLLAFFSPHGSGLYGGGEAPLDA